MGTGERGDMQDPGGVLRRILVLLAYGNMGATGAAVLDKRSKLHALLLQDEGCGVHDGTLSHGLAEIVVMTADVDRATSMPRPGWEACWACGTPAP
jgi:hypothetical protein